MNANSIDTSEIKKQLELKLVEKRVNGLPIKANGDVYCPMCDVYHANNTFCQV